MPGAALCPDCGAALVDKMPQKPRSKWSDEPLVSILHWGETCLFGPGILEEHDIKYLQKDGYLYVLESRAQEARSLLEPFIESPKKNRRPR